MILRDCPRCRRTNVQGVVDYDKDDKTMVGVETVAGTILGALIAGPFGAVLGGSLFNKGTKELVKRRNEDGRILYHFTCPNPSCKHEWTDWAKE